VGPGTLLFGTDGPTFRLYTFNNQKWVKTIQELPQNAPPGITFSREEIEMILWKNAQRILDVNFEK
jgi:predicted TIM-barrel fold metal-dependent hydrolase